MYTYILISTLKRNHIINSIGVGDNCVYYDTIVAVIGATIFK